MILGVLETAIYTTNLAAAERFYTEVLGLSVYSREEGRHVFFRCGAGMFLVFNPETTQFESRYPELGLIPAHGSRGPGHMAFAIREAEVDSWRTRLQQHNVPIESEVRWPKGGHSLYFRDPAGNCIELATPRLWSLPEPSVSGP